MKLKSLVLAITYKCNSQCSFCSIWKNKTEEEIDMSYYKRLPFFESINITGGEPFMRADIDDIIKIIKKKTKRVVIATNGLLTERILKTAKKYPEIGFRISIDGLKEKNDEMRGIPGGFKKSIDTILGLKKLGVKDIGICSTFGYGNEDQMEKVYQLAKKLDIEFLSIVRHDSFYYSKKNSPYDTKLVIEKLKWLIKKYLNSFNPKYYFRAYYTQGSIDFVKKKERAIKCDAGLKSFYLDPYGVIFPCVVLNKQLGNIKTDNFKDLIGETKCNLNCWMPCTVNEPIKDNLHIVIPWILKRKLSMLFNRKSY
ncbi:radical SAM protein [Candidatus Pacearchaeota archaeon]|nr:radical SAM protein [Candidatus Pacearchaeota archaeon]